MTKELYAAQRQGLESVSGGPWFPQYDPAYVKNSKGLTGFYCKSYDALYSFASYIKDNSPTIPSGASTLLDKACSPLASLADNTIYPVNPVNGKRHLVLITRSFEEFLGSIFFDSAIHQSATIEIVKSKKYNHEEMTDQVDQIVTRMKTAGKSRDILNPTGQGEFEYKTMTLKSSQKNAFAVMGGSMAVYTGLLEAIKENIKKIKASKIEFADGSSATVNLNGVTENDVIAALMGHEMTHIASRHSIVRLAINACIGALLWIVQEVLLHNLKENTSKDKPENIQARYEFYAYLLSCVADLLQEATNLLHSRYNEYEADITSVYLARNAGYNPLGALMLQEILEKDSTVTGKWLHKKFEFLTTHPCGENRKKAILAAICSLQQQDVTLEDPKLKVYAGDTEAKRFTTYVQP